MNADENGTTTCPACRVLPVTHRIETATPNGGQSTSLCRACARTTLRALSALGTGAFMEPLPGGDKAAKPGARLNGHVRRRLNDDPEQGTPTPTIGRGERRPVTHRMRNLERDLVVLDCEWSTTPRDRDHPLNHLLALAVRRLRPDGTGYAAEYSFNPGVPIDAHTSAVHGYTDEIVAGLPPFSAYAARIADDVADADAAGYQMRTDIELIETNLADNGVTWPNRKTRLVDGIKLWQTVERRRLADAHERFVGAVSDDVSAHDAAGDTAMTAALIEALADDMTAEEIDERTDPGRIDPAGKFVRDANGKIVFGFGAHRGRPVLDNLGFVDWMVGKDFPVSTRKVCQGILRRAEEISRQQAEHRPQASGYGSYGGHTPPHEHAHRNESEPVNGTATNGRPGNAAPAA